MIDYAALLDAHLEVDNVLLAAEACRAFIMKHSCQHPHGILGGDLTSACHRQMHPLDAHERERVLVLLIKMPSISTTLGAQHSLRFWKAELAPHGAFNMRNRRALGGVD